MEIISYPKWKYHATLPAIIIQDAIEETELGDEWKDSPTDFTIKKAKK